MMREIQICLRQVILQTTERKTHHIIFIHNKQTSHAAFKLICLKRQIAYY